MPDIAETIFIGALARRESCGSDFRLDSPERDDVNWLKHTLVTFAPEGASCEYHDIRTEVEGILIETISNDKSANTEFLKDSKSL